MYVKNFTGVKGELTSNKDFAVFVPDESPYGPNRLTFTNCYINIGSKDDDDCIMVVGIIDILSTDFCKKVTEVFYPV